MLAPFYQWIGWVGKIFTGNRGYFPMKIMVGFPAQKDSRNQSIETYVTRYLTKSSQLQQNTSSTAIPQMVFLSKHMQRETDCQIVTPNILRAFNIWIYFRDVIHVSPQSMGVLRFYQQELGIEQCHKPPIGADLEYHFSNKMWEGVWWWVYHMIPFPQIWLNFNIQNPKWIDSISNVFFGWPGNQYELEQIIDHM